MRTIARPVTILLLIAFLVGCSPGNGPAAGPGPAPDQTPTAVPYPDSLAEMLAYVPYEWADLHLPGFGGSIFFLDFARMRSELGLTDLSGASTRQEKIPFLTGLETQNFDYLPLGVEAGGSSGYETWGWDVADIDQALYFPDLQTSILRGNFANPGIGEALRQKGFAEEPLGDFLLFSDTNYAYAWKADTLLVARVIPDVGFDPVRWLAEFPHSGRLAITEHPALQAILPWLESPWGVLLLPSPDMVAWFENIRTDMANWDSSLGPETAEVLREFAGPVHTPRSAAWDFMAAAYRPEGDQFVLRLVYHFPSAPDARDNLALVEKTLTETPSMAVRNSAWRDLAAIDQIRAREDCVIVDLRTSRRSLLGDAVKRRDYWGLLPFEYR